MAAGESQGIRSIGRRALWTRIFLGTQMALHALMLPVLGIVLYHAARSPYGLLHAINLNPGLLVPLIGLSAVLAVLILVAGFLGGVLFLLWVHRASRNLVEAGMRDMAYSPGWAAGSFFVPFVNFIVPYRALREIANRSAGEDIWQVRNPVPDLTSWWACMLAGGFFRLIVTGVGILDRVRGLVVTTPPAATLALNLLATLLLLAAAFFLFRLVGKITADQIAMRHAAGAFD